MNEKLTIHRINNQLINLGWNIEGINRNVFLEGECKTEEQKKKLGKKRPDYILYETNSTAPLAIIEAKKPNTNLDFALKQGINYAKNIGAKIIFASDGFIVKLLNINEDVLTINGELINDFVNENILKKLISSSNIEIGENILKNRNELIKLFNRANNYLRQDGIDAGINSIYEFCCILFIKIKSESDKTIEDFYTWDSLIKNTGKSLYEHYNKIIEYFKNRYEGIFTDIKIEKPVALEKIVDSLKEINLSKTEIDIKGSAYEYFLKRYASGNKSVLGQYFTPRHIIEMMCMLLNPQINDSIYDPFCGTGGMLIECYKYIRKNIIQQEDIKKLNTNVLFGNDIVLGASQLAKMNMVLLGDGHSNINKLNSLENPVKDEYNCVITNIPFNLQPIQTGSLYETGETNANNICIRHCIKAIKNGGRACIIVPENICYEPSYKNIRKFLAENSDIKAVIRLPRETFKSYTTARTCILWLTDIKIAKTESFTYIEIKKDGFSDGMWREPIPENDIPEILEFKDNLKQISNEKTFDADYNFIENEIKINDITKKENEWFLKDVIEMKIEKQKLDPNKIYQEPRLSSATNTISSRGNGRYGKNINGNKVIVAPGDLVIATLHTQSGNGLFAISDDYYIATSQIVAKIKENIVNKEYLILCLQKILPQLSKSDLVGRETYKKEEILKLKIPKQPKEFIQDLEKINKYKKKIEKKIEKMKLKILEHTNRYFK